MKKLLEYVTRGILGSKPKITKKTEGEVTVFTIKVPKEDMGKIIGKGGKIIRAIRTIAKIKAAVEKKAVKVELEESQEL